MSKKWLSIIVPVFNCEEIVPIFFKNVKTLFGDGIEIIIIDDCSTDKTGCLIENFIKGNSDVIFHKLNENVGPGEARNIGLHLATGKYVTFLDFDDRFESSFLQYLLPECSKDVDVVLFDYYKVFSGKTINKKTVRFSNGKKNNDISNLIVNASGSPWGKVYKRKVLIDNDVRFLKKMRNEDMPFTKVALSFCDTFSYLETPLYYYCDNQNSITHNRSLSDINSGRDAYLYIEGNICAKCKEDVLYALFLNDYLYGSAFYSVGLLSKRKWTEFVSEIEKTFKGTASSEYKKWISVGKRIVLFAIKKRHYRLLKFLSGVKKT